jgi:hypothetical protein
MPPADSTPTHGIPGPHDRPTPERPAAGFLIDPSARSITPWLYNGDWQTIAPAIRIGQSPFTIVEIGDGDIIYVDDEGLLKPLDWFFAVKGGHQPYAGCGLVLGSDDEGGTVSARIALADIKRRVLHLRILSNRPARFLAWDAFDPTPGATAMTLDAIERWMADLRPTFDPPHDTKA